MFVFEIPITVHNDLHAYLHDVPVPSGDCQFLWKQYQKEKQWLHTTDLIGVCNWLIANSGDREFRWAMLQQKNFFLARKVY